MHRFRFRALVAILLCLMVGIAVGVAELGRTPEPNSISPKSAAAKVGNDRQPLRVGIQTPVTPANSAPSSLPDEPREEAPTQVAQAEKEDGPVVYPAALFNFDERGTGVKDYGIKVSDLLFARLAVNDIYLVDRADLKKTLGELELNISGVVKSSEAAKIGQLTGAKLFIFGSVLQVDKQVYIVAKVVGTETSRVIATSVNGKASDELAPLIEKLGEQLAEKIKEQAGNLVAKVTAPQDRLANLKKTMKKGDRPAVMVQVREQHVGAAPIDPAVQTEVMRFCKETGFTVLDPELGLRSRADILLLGEAQSETAARFGNLISVKARVELRAVDRATDKVLAVDRQTTIVVDLTEQIAGKSALEEAAAILAERMLPKLVKE